MIYHVQVQGNQITEGFRQNNTKISRLLSITNIWKMDLKLPFQPQTEI